MISRDENKIKDLLSRDDGAIDTIDDDGYSALHYACMYRCPNAVRLLRGAGGVIFSEPLQTLIATLAHTNPYPNYNPY